MTPANPKISRFPIVNLFIIAILVPHEVRTGYAVWTPSRETLVRRSFAVEFN